MYENPNGNTNPVKGLLHDAESITEAHVTPYEVYLKGSVSLPLNSGPETRGWRAMTLWELAILSGIFRMAVDYEEIADNPCRKVDSLPENNQRTRHLSFEEEDRLFAKLTGEREYLRTLVTVAVYAGPRRGELLKLRWPNVDFGLNLINFTET